MLSSSVPSRTRPFHQILVPEAMSASAAPRASLLPPAPAPAPVYGGAYDCLVCGVSVRRTPAPALRCARESVHSMLLQLRAHARAFAKFANRLPISMQNKCYSRSICMPVRFSRGHGRDIQGHGMLFYMR